MSPRPLSPAWAYVHDMLSKYPNTPSLTLAKKIMAENTSMFTTDFAQPSIQEPKIEALFDEMLLEFSMKKANA